MAQALTQVGKYRIERELGRGAMGVVYKAFDPVVERSVALKTIPLGVEDAQALVHRLQREAKSVGQLEHPNIVTLYDAGEAEGLFYLAMQFIEGENLEARLLRQRVFSVQEVYDLLRQVCDGLDYAHQHGVIHRDIKPANIMITRDGVVKLTDFGIAKQTGSAGASTHGLIVGTPSYMSPEQALGKTLDGRSDIFSLGSILYELLTGEKAFPGQNTTTVMYKIVYEAPVPILSLRPALDLDMAAIVTMALAKKPEERFQTCSELARALELYMNKELAPLPDISAQLAGATTMAGGEESSAPTQRISAPSPPPPPEMAVGEEARRVMPPPEPARATSLPAPAPLPQHKSPWAWLGFGVLATLLLVVVILLVVQLRHPSPPVDTGQRAAVQPPATQTASNPPAKDAAPGALKTGEPASAPAAGARTDLKSPSTPAESSLTEAVKPAPPVAKKSPAAAPRRERTSAKPETTNPSPAPAAPGLSALGQLGAGDKPAVTPPTPGPTTPTAAVTNPPSAPPTPPAAEDFSSLVIKGDLAFQQSKYQDALNAYSKAYELNNRSREVRRKIVVTLTLLGRPEEAQKYK